ncbi:MAG TPA: cytochrome c peroxidase [Hyphomicrobium sp.]|nr:cytochrome c peroxidase [Hyphomicrobium sp.]
MFENLRPSRERKMQIMLALVCALVISGGAIWQATDSRSTTPPSIDSVEKLGEALFFDVNLSRNRTQACSTCHSPDFAFTDPREVEGAGRAVSSGDDGESLGDRNTPTVSYASLAPAFRYNEKNKAEGGFFWDGRAHTLEAQAGGPPLNPIEMAMGSKADVASRLRENAQYAKAFETLFGAGTLDSADTAYDAMTKSIAAFERTDVFQPFDSKYDRALRGEVKLTDQEELGRVLFFSNQFTNCIQCHKQKAFGGAEKETFTNYQYHNIGTPVNSAARRVNGSKPDRIDAGLHDNPAAIDPSHVGEFKVPTLRNVAVTGPYMHNGVFKNLRTVIAFYNKYNSKNPKHKIDPETNAEWAAPEVAENLATKELESGSALNSKRIDALVAFLKTLTDKRYEHLLEATPVQAASPVAVPEPATAPATP